MLLISGFSIALRIIFTVVGIALIGSGFRALLEAKKEAYDSESLKVNIWAAVVMIVAGILLFGYGFFWVIRIFWRLYYG